MKVESSTATTPTARVQTPVQEHAAAVQANKVETKQTAQNPSHLGRSVDTTA